VGLGIFAWASGNAIYAPYLGIPAVPGAGEVAIFCGAMSGAGLGFLWFNTYPAQVFMGDVGALALGGALGAVSVIVRQEVVVLLMGGIFVLETASVILQVASFKLRGKRIFRMAPIHHHFELKGWAEPKVIVRFWIISLLLVLLTTLIMPLCVMASWRYIQARVKEFMICLLIMESAMIGVFCALDFILFFVFWEAMLIPMALLIGVWGNPARR